MSMSTNPSAPYYPPFNPYSLDPSQILASMQNNALTTNIYDGTTKTIGAVNESQRLLTSEIAGVNKNIYDTIAQNGIAIERTSANNMITTERANSQVSAAVERANAQVSAAVERTNAQLATSVERNGGNIQTAIERVAGEGRLTTTVTDAASRQASNDTARDILSAVERNGAAATSVVKDTHNGLLGAIERNAGENRMTTVTVGGQQDSKLTDVRHAVISSLNLSTNELMATMRANHEGLTSQVQNGAWENRNAMGLGFASSMLEGQKSSALNALQTAQMGASSIQAATAASIAVQQQLSNQHLTMSQQSAHQYASQLLESHKLSDGLSSKTDMQFAAMISKSDGHYASIMLEQQKVKECLSLQLQEAKYEALKNKMELSKEMGDCCCEVKEKIDQRAQDVIGTVDTLDRNRLRDGLTVSENENNLFRTFELFDDYRGGRRGHGGHRGSRGRRH